METKQTIKRVLTVIGVFIIILLVVGGIRALFTPSNDTVRVHSPANYSAEEYISKAEANCEDDLKAFCRCVYTDIIADGGVEKAWEFDKAVAKDPNYSTPEIINYSEACYHNLK